MKIIIFYGSKHGMTRRAAARIAQGLSVSADIADVDALSEGGALPEADVVMFLAPTYGDEELHDGMDRFFRLAEAQIRGRLFILGELGNSYGYDDHSFGAMRIMRERLLARGAREYFEPVSIDAFPRQDWDTLDRWIAALNRRLAADV